MKQINWEALGLAFLRAIIILLLIWGTILLATIIYDKFGAGAIIVGICVSIFTVMVKLFYDELK